MPMTPEEAKTHAMVDAANIQYAKDKELGLVGSPGRRPSMGLDMGKLTREAQEAWRKSIETDVLQTDAQGNVTTVKGYDLSGLGPQREDFASQQAYEEALGQSDVAAIEKAAFSKDPQAELARLPGMLGQLFGTPQRISGFRSLSREQQVAELRRSALDARNRNDLQTAMLIENMIEELLNPTGYDPTQEGGLRPIGAYSAYRPVPGRGEIGMTGLNRSNQVFDRALPLRTTTGFPTDIAFLAGGGAINKPTMAVVGEAGPELAMLQPGDSIIPLSTKQANQLLDSGTPGYQRGIGYRPPPSFLTDLDIQFGRSGRIGAPRISQQEPEQPDALQSFMPGAAPSVDTILRNIGIAGEPAPGMTSPGAKPPGISLFTGTEPIPDLAATGPGGSAASLSIPPVALASDEYMRLLGLAETGEFTNEDLGKLLTKQDQLRSDVNRIRLELGNLSRDKDTGDVIDLSLQASLDAELAVAEGQLSNLAAQINALRTTDTSAEAMSEAKAREAGKADAQEIKREENIAFGNFAIQLFNSLGIEFPPEIMEGIAGGNVGSTQLNSLLSLFLDERARTPDKTQAIQYGFA
jgi:hypothetical protein|tara:strand:+ start:518 stop:2257 length:1740 start_codon:yes stop_codon:yes gene_type:complete